MQPEVTADLKELDGTLTTIEKVLNLEDLVDRARELEDQAADPSLWNDPDYAQTVTSELSRVQAQLKRVRGLRQRLEDLPVMYDMAEEESADSPEEAKEAIAGVFVIEARDLDHAIELAAMTPIVDGGVEVRPLVGLDFSALDADADAEGGAAAAGAPEGS